jgi:hypothetical protein
MQKIALTFFLVAVVCAGMPASADDSSASLAAGGIVLTKADAIRMAREDLYISPKQVRVSFVFANDTDADIDTVVAFVLPDIDLATFWGSPLGTVTDDPVNFIGFKASSDGKPIAFKVEQRAFAKGKDVTALIASTGLQINLVAGDGYRKLDALSPDKHKRLIDAGVLAAEDNNYYPQWSVQTRFYWTQHFPAHASVAIEHSYQPVTGQSFFGKDDATNKDATRGNDYCFDAPTKARISSAVAARLRANADNGGYLNAYWTDYVLTTANNWKGPIGLFHLTLDKLKPENILSLCWDGAVEKTGPTTFEATQQRFAPRHDIHLLVLQ